MVLPEGLSYPGKTWTSLAQSAVPYCEISRCGNGEEERWVEQSVGVFTIDNLSGDVETQLTSCQQWAVWRVSWSQRPSPTWIWWQPRPFAGEGGVARGGVYGNTHAHTCTHPHTHMHTHIRKTYSLMASTAFLSFSLRNSSNMVALSSRYFSAASSFLSSVWRWGRKRCNQQKWMCVCACVCYVYVCMRVYMLHVCVMCACVCVHACACRCVHVCYVCMCVCVHHQNGKNVGPPDSTM